MTNSKANDTALTLSATVATALGNAAASDGKLATAQHNFTTAALKFHDVTVAEYGAEVLTANQRSKADDKTKATHAALKEAYIATQWSAAFLAKVNDPATPTDKAIGAPKKGMTANTKGYWQQQKGKVWKPFLARVLNAASVRDAANLPEADAANEATQGASRKAPLVDRCKKNVNTAIAAMTAAHDAKKDKAEVIPPHVNYAAFTAFAALAIDCLETGKARQDKVETALKALRALKLVK